MACQLIFTILSAVAEAERDRTRERIAEVKKDQRERGRYLGGKPPFVGVSGTAGELVPVPEQQAAIKRMRRLKDQGLALRVIADRMTAAGIQISHVWGEEGTRRCRSTGSIRLTLVWSIDKIIRACCSTVRPLK
jgi:DNA invertase Pin-like site-specific DNA recombinase